MQADTTPAVVNQLAQLFFDLEFCENRSVSPTIELAKLALVTSKDEEEDDGETDGADRGGTDSSNDTDATLVESEGGRFVAPPESMDVASDGGTVLGKRSRVGDADHDAEEREKDYVMVSKPGSPAEEKEKDGDGDVEMGEVGAGAGAGNAKVAKPAAPVRKSTESVMMFGASFLFC